MKLIHKPLLVSLLFGASGAMSNAAVLFTSAGQLVNEANVSLSPGISRSTTDVGTLYFKFTVNNPASNFTTEPGPNPNYYFAAMQFYEGANERLGVGNGWDAWAYGAFNTSVGSVDLNSATPEPSQSFQYVRSTDMTTIVIRVDYISGGNDSITVWLNPNLGLTEAAQGASLTTNFFADATFDNILLREGGLGDGWNFSDIAIAENSTDTGFFAAVPEPSAALLGAFGMIGLLRRRR